MKINGLNYNFGRCLRLTFWHHGSEILVVEHAPELNRLKLAAIDVKVQDRPSASDKDQPGFMANVTIYNPDDRLINAIADGAVWINQYLKNPDTAPLQDILNTTRSYFNDRLRVVIEAGYIQGEGDAKSANYNKLIEGYVQGSALFHKGTDEVLTFGVYDIDPSAMTASIAEQYKGKSYNQLIADNKRVFKNTWHETLEYYIKSFERYRIQTSADLTKNKTKTDIKNIIQPKNSSVLAVQNNWNTGESVITKEQMPSVPVEEEDRKSTNWFKIIYVTSLSDYMADKKLGHIDTSTNISLMTEMQRKLMPEGGSVSGDTLEQLLDGLCVRGNNLHWKKDTEHVSTNVYVIWRGAPTKSFVQGNVADIKIWNYQYLLESPSVTGSGQLQIKMIFNPDCKCMLNIALMLSNLQTEDGQDSIATQYVKKNFQEGLLGSMAAQSSGLSTYGNIQVTGSNAVAALNKESKTAKERGYLFNTGFPIISVEHILSTYGKDWTTIVKTAPSLYGFRTKVAK